MTETNAAASDAPSEVEFLRGYENGYAAAYNDAIRLLRSGGNDAQAEVVREELWYPLMKAKTEYVAAQNEQSSGSSKAGGEQPESEYEEGVPRQLTTRPGSHSG